MKTDMSIERDHFRVLFSETTMIINNDDVHDCDFSDANGGTDYDDEYGKVVLDNVPKPVRISLPAPNDSRLRNPGYLQACPEIVVVI